MLAPGSNSCASAPDRRVARSVSVPVAVATSGNLPLVSPLSGSPAVGFEALQYRLEGLGFWWALLFFGPPGWVALALIARVKGGVVVKVPLAESELRRISWLQEARGRGVWGAVGFGVLALIARSFVPLAVVCGVGAVLCVVVAVYSLIVLPWIRPSIHVDLLVRKVTFLEAADQFADAVEGVGTPT